MNTTPSDYLEGAAQGTRIWMRVVGRGNFKLGPTMKAYVTGAIQHGARHLQVDMQPCKAMDSTFMGVLAGLAMQLKPLGGAMVLLHPDERNREALLTLGLGTLIEMPPDDGPDPTAIPSAMRPALRRLDPASNVANTATSLLAAHENLIDAAPENRPRFDDLVTQLKHEISERR